MLQAYTSALATLEASVLIDELRNRGLAVTVFSAEDTQEGDDWFAEHRSAIEEGMCRAGFDVIDLYGGAIAED